MSKTYKQLMSEVANPEIEGTPKKALRKLKAAFLSKEKGVLQTAVDRYRRKLGTQARKARENEAETARRREIDNTIGEAMKLKNPLVTNLRVGDKIHMGLAQRGGAGVRGTVTKIDGDTVHLVSDFGNQTHKGPMKNVVKESFLDRLDTLISEATLKAALMTGDKTARAKASWRQAQINSQRGKSEVSQARQYISPEDLVKATEPSTHVMSSKELADNQAKNYLHFSPRTYVRRLDATARASAAKRKAKTDQPWKRDEVTARVDAKQRVQSALAALRPVKRVVESDEVTEATFSKYMKAHRLNLTGSKVSYGDLELARKKREASMLRRGGADDEIMRKGIEPGLRQGQDYRRDMVKYRFLQRAIKSREDGKKSPRN